MALSNQYMTTQEYAEKVGLSASTISKWLRSGKIQGEKQNGKWLIPVDQNNQSSETSAKSQKPTPSETKQTRQGQSYTVAQFSEMTYLTEFGVIKWLQEGRLKGAKDTSGQWLVSRENLNDSNVKRLIRD